MYQEKYLKNKKLYKKLGGMSSELENQIICRHCTYLNNYGNVNCNICIKSLGKYCRVCGLLNTHNLINCEICTANFITGILDDTKVNLTRIEEEKSKKSIHDNKSLIKRSDTRKLEVRGDGFCLIHSILLAYYLNGGKEDFDLETLIARFLVDINNPHIRHICSIEEWEYAYAIELLKAPLINTIQGDVFIKLLAHILKVKIIVLSEIDNSTTEFGYGDYNIRITTNGAHYSAIIKICLEHTTLSLKWWNSMMKEHPYPEKLTFT